MSNPETQLVNKILPRLRSIPRTEAIKIHGDEHSRTGDPDIIGSHEGRSFVIEVKVPGNRPSKIQQYRLKLWKKAGARTGVAYNVEQAVKIATGGNSNEDE